MRNSFFLMLPVLFLFAACSKSKPDTTCRYTPPVKTATAAEINNLKAWLDSKSLPYTQHSSGIFYQVITPGAGTTPGVCSNILVKYKGTLTSGAGFDSSYKRNPGGTPFVLGELITGWQIGIPLIQKGGSIMLYIPPSLGYGAQEGRDENNNIVVPANSILVFKIDLADVQ